MTVPTSCLDPGQPGGQALIGIRQDTSAASFVGARTDAKSNASPSPIFIIGPVDKSALANYLSNSSSQYLLDIHPSQDEEPTSAITFTVEQWTSSDFRLCYFDGLVKPVSPGQTIKATSKSQHVLLALDAMGALNDDASFSMTCSYYAILTL